MKHRRNSTLARMKLQRGAGIIGEKVRLRDKKLSDVRNDYRWQSDPELARFDAAPTLKVAFAVYLLDYADSVHRPGTNRYPLAVETLDGIHIGNCTCYDIDEEKAEAQLGIMIGDRDYQDRGYGTDTITAFVDHIYRTTGLNRIYLKTLDWNLRAQQCFRNSGFITCGEFRRNNTTFMLMELLREQWEQRCTKE